MKQSIRDIWVMLKKYYVYIIRIQEVEKYGNKLFFKK